MSALGGSANAAAGRIEPRSIRAVSEEDDPPRCEATAPD